MASFITMVVFFTLAITVFVLTLERVYNMLFPSGTAMVKDTHPAAPGLWKQNDPQSPQEDPHGT